MAFTVVLAENEQTLRQAATAMDGLDDCDVGCPVRETWQLPFARVVIEDSPEVFLAYRNDLPEKGAIGGWRTISNAL